MVSLCSLLYRVPSLFPSASPLLHVSLLSLLCLILILLFDLAPQMVSRRPLSTPGRELTDGQGGWFLHHPGQPELPRGLLHLCQVLTIPDTALTLLSLLTSQNAEAMKGPLEYDPMVRSMVA